jgi:adenylate cyclase
MWRAMLVDGDFTAMRRWRLIFSHLPKEPRCEICHAPFHGIGGGLARALNKRPSQLNPKFCTACEDFVQQFPGGAEVPMAMLFADVRGSTTLAEHMSPAEFRGLIDQFYRTATRVLTESDALIEKLAGDSVTALYFPGFVGPEYAARAVQAAQDLLIATSRALSGSQRIPVGVGVHSGIAFAGAVGSKGSLIEFTALGDAMNVAARLASHAGPDEIVFSEEVCVAAHLDAKDMEQRQLTLKGRTGPVGVRVLKVTGGSA